MKYQSRKFIALTSLWVLLSSVGAMASPNLIIDGGFEDPVICPTPSEVTDDGFSLWSVDGDVMLVCQTLWQPHSGSQSLSLNGTDAGFISQDIPTIASKSYHTKVGKIYRVVFWLAGNPLKKSTDKRNNDKTLNVFAGLDVHSFVFNTTNTSPTDMGWVAKGFFFRAADTTTTISFESTTPGAFGPVIDDIEVTLQCPPLAISDINDPNFDIECI